MSKVCLHVTNDAKLCIGIKKIFLKDHQQALLKIITWIKKFKNCQQEWDRACIKTRLLVQKLKIQQDKICKQSCPFPRDFANVNVINICYHS
jgi:hypothetical protein